MRRLLSAAVIATIAWSAVPLAAVAAPIASFSDGFGVSPAPDSVFVSLGATGAFSAPAVFEDVELDAASVGTVFTATALNDPHFNALVAILTNGVDDAIYVNTSEGANFVSNLHSSSAPESSGARFAGSPDFAGSVISSIDMRVDLFFTDSDGFLNWGVTFTLNSPDPVPEPALHALVALGLLAGALARARDA